MKNTQGKTRSIEKPYQIWKNERAGWQWNVLKHYKSPDAEANDPYARVFCAVKSPMTYDEFELGDVYLKDIRNTATLVFSE